MVAKESRLRNWLNDAAAAVGFHSVHVTAATLPETTGANLQRFIEQGFAGDMGWLADSVARRSRPDAMWTDAVSAIVLTMNYGPDHDPMDNIRQHDRGNISVYARGRDYHDVMKGKLKQLASQFAARSKANVKVFVDTAPLMEKPLAAQAGAGWQGKHTNLVSRSAGSWLFLGTILTDADLLHDPPETDHCGGCTRCLDVCPTDAFVAPYQLDARRCISYLTIEHKGQIPRKFRRAIGNRIFGCDDCLAVCPWNKFAAKAAEGKFVGPKPMPALAELLQFDDAAFRKFFAGSPVRRAGHIRFLRNVLVATGNSGDGALVPLVVMRLRHDDPLVRGMAVWALAELTTAGQLHALMPDYLPDETDKTVLAEWESARRVHLSSVES
ncbi:MAG: tRNA epoxyqueuosine(34) reductase QueG [Proteobacteria bacterium]|nr:tRNA epoxyqueuosine(34) reductase QueG [Pseudomonadota bacterium]MDA0845286.1 tRNA epoxyqueuosine(34) reductase QueG [Pseudomonadota bacterium]